MKIDESEQWKSDGKCSLCRRETYCKSDCRKHKEKISMAVNEAVRGVIINTYEGACKN